MDISGFQQHSGGIVHLEIAVILFWGNADFCFEKGGSDSRARSRSGLPTVRL